ncbi:Calx-beta domain-containing protein [Marinobacter sp.]|uniref:Calx-beta domain-containing protein n=1 Tax=Marinobacter sp. TaxID=50741 RepID=UPI003A92642F
MRAELFPRPVMIMQVVIVLLLALTASGCKTEKNPDQPTILGIPPATAYLGVEYYYNFGAYGGEDILDYTLTNAPSWLALEDTSNKARQGVIMRGVPGLSGGARGDADLGKLTNINLVSTDGEMAGAQPFDIEVKYNALALESDPFTEGASPTIPDTRRERCELPDLETPGEHSFTINTYDANGAVSGTRDLTLPTRSVFVKVLLDRPSVTRVAVAFDLTSDYDASSCDPGVTAPDQRCDHGKANAGDAIPGQDIVALGSGSDSLLENLSYLTYEADNTGVNTGGVVTFEPGITECYIRLEVVDDSFPEPSEALQLNLTEVRSGLAGLGETNGGVRTTLVIDDNEPRVSLETIVGGSRDTLNVGGSRTYVARLTGEREGAVRAKLGHSDDSTARLGTEFSTSLPGDELVFPEGVDELTFMINVIDPGTYSNPGLDDRFILLGLNESFQLGRENYARAAEDETLRISINELVSPLVFGSGNSFVATDVTVGHAGRIFVTGYASVDNDRVMVGIFSQKGGLLQMLEVSGAGDQLSGPEPMISVARREVTKNNIKTDRFELLVTYSTDRAVAGTTEQGGMDIVSSLYWYDEASNGGEYVETWTTRTGTTGDDLVRWAGLNTASGFVVIAGETDGVWPGQAATGGFDSFLQRIDSLADGNGFAPALAWTRQVGSSADDRVAGASATGISPSVFGSARGAVNGEPSLGGEDAYFYTTASGDGNLMVYQRGTDADEQIASGIVDGSTLWLLGNGSNEYTVEQEEDSLSLTSQPDSSASGFVLGYTTAGDLVRAFNLNDDGDVSEERFVALTGFAGDLVAAGKTSGDYTGTAGTSGSSAGIISRVSLVPESEPDAENSVFRNEWRGQLIAGDSEILRLANYRDDEIVALARVGSFWLILLFSPEGVLLNL